MHNQATLIYCRTLAILTMKITLNQNIVVKLTLDKKPTALTNDQLVYESNPNGAAYTIFNEHRDAPTGFGVKIAKTKKTYIINDISMAEK
jgi:hypothetical protein